MKTEQLIFQDSPEAATPVQVTAYRDAGGFLHLAESQARYASATAARCHDCGAVTAAKYYTRCEACRAKADAERFANLPLVEWDGETPLVLFGSDTYFFDAEQANEHYMEHPDARFCLCRPVYLRQVDEDYFTDDLPEDGEVPDEVREGLAQLNQIIAKQEPVAWLESAERVDLTKPVKPKIA